MNDPLSHSEIERIIDEQERELDTLFSAALAKEQQEQEAAAAAAARRGAAASRTGRWLASLRRLLQLLHLSPGKRP